MLKSLRLLRLLKFQAPLFTFSKVERLKFTGSSGLDVWGFRGLTISTSSMFFGSLSSVASFAGLKAFLCYSFQGDEGVQFSGLQVFY